VYIITTS